MAEITLTGRTGLVLENFKDLLAEVVAFQTWTGEGTAELAEAHVAIFDAPDSMARPRVMVSWGGSITVEAASHSAGDEFNPWIKGAVVRAMFEIDETGAEADDPENAKKKFYEDVETVLEGIEALAGQDARLSILGYTLPLPQIRESEKVHGEGTKYYQMEVQFNL